MQATLQRMVAIVAMALLAGTGVAMMAVWSPTSVGLISPASAQEDDDDDGNDDDDDDGQAPAGGVATGQGGTSTATGDDDDDDGNDDDDDDGQAPAGGVATGQGGTSTATGDDDDDDGNGDDDDDGQVPAGGVATGQGGTAAESLTAERASNERSTGTSVIGWAAPLAALAVGGAMVARPAFARLGGRRD